MRILEGLPKSIPIFYKDNDGEYQIMCATYDSLPIEKGNKLIYLGKEVDWSEWDISVQELSEV